MKLALWGIAVAILLSITAVLGSLWDLSEKLALKFPFLSGFIWVIEYGFVGGILLLCAAVLFYLLGLLFNFISYAIAVRPNFNDYVIEAVRSEDLEVLMRLYGSANGQTNMDVTKAIYSKCKHSFRKVRNVKLNEVCAYFVVLPLTDTGVKSIQGREFQVIDPDHSQWFRVKFVRGCSAYIGAVVAATSDRNAKAFVLEQLIKFVKEKKFSCVYARATTPDGLRLVKKWEFAALFPNEGTGLGAYFYRKLAA